MEIVFLYVEAAVSIPITRSVNDGQGPARREDWPTQSKTGGGQEIPQKAVEHPGALLPTSDVQQWGFLDSSGFSRGVLP